MSDKQDEDRSAGNLLGFEEIERQLRSKGLSFGAIGADNDPYKEILCKAREQEYSFPKLDHRKVSKLVRTLVKNGDLEWELNGTSLSWIKGLAAFCAHGGVNIIAEIAEVHWDASIDLYGIAMDQFEAFGEDFLRDEDLDPYEAEKRGAYLAPNLSISDRHYLTQNFINAVLRPYLSAQRELMRIFFQNIESAHRAGQFLVFKREADRSFGVVLPGTGFDGLGSYCIPRSSYLRGFKYSEHEVDPTLLGSGTPGLDPEALAFLTVDQVPEFCIKTPKANRGGRPKGHHYAVEDAPLIERMHEIIILDETSNVRGAARSVHDATPNLVAGGATRESKIKRLERAYRVAYPLGG